MKEFGELWSSNQKVIDADVDPPNRTFFREVIFWPLEGAGPSNFYTFTTPKMYFKPDVGRRAASSWARAIFLGSFCFTPLFNSPQDLRAPSADRRETSPHYHYLGALYNASPNVRGSLP